MTVEHTTYVFMCFPLTDKQHVKLHRSVLYLRGRAFMIVDTQKYCYILFTDYRLVFTVITLFTCYDSQSQVSCCTVIYLFWDYHWRACLLYYVARSSHGQIVLLLTQYMPASYKMML